MTIKAASMVMIMLLYQQHYEPVSSVGIPVDVPDYQIAQDEGTSLGTVMLFPLAKREGGDASSLVSPAIEGASCIRR